MMHCCDSINIVRNGQILEFDGHLFQVSITYCKNCGSKKATSHIKEIKNEQS